MGAGRRVSIKDVAREAGVSVTTVSHALNGKGRLNPATRRRVQDVAERLGYRPNPAARSLVSGKTGLIAVVASLPADVEMTDFGYYTEVIGAASGAAVARDYALVVAPPSGSTYVWDRVPLDGVIVVDPIEGEAALPVLRERSIPFVTIGRDPTGHDRDAVVAGDDVAGARTVFDHLADAGGTRVALISIPPVYSFVRDTIVAYRAWCDERGTPPIHVVPAVEDMVHRREAVLAAIVEELLTRPQAPDAIYCPIERLGLAVADAIQARGARIPEDVLLVTTRDVGHTAAADPPVTTLEWDPGALGRRSATVLLDMIEGTRTAPLVDIVPTTLVRRASTTRA
jgi:DNA-binding LacI/PurR family transcriptional regulator